MRYVLILLFATTLHSASIDSDADSLGNLNQKIDPLIELRNELQDIFDDPNFSNAFWGVSIQSLKSGETIYKLNADKLFRPASLHKLLTTSTALLLLGPNYKFTTSFYTDGKVLNGILEGNLYIMGEGDPTIVSGLTNHTEDHFSQFCDSLNKIGIYSIKGNIIADDRNFDNEQYGRGWLNEYELNWFAPPSGSFCLNNNSIQIILEPTENKQLSEITYSSHEHIIEIINNVTTGLSNSIQTISYERKGNNVIQLNGSIPKDSESYIINIPVEDPTSFYVNSFYELLLLHGISVTGYAIAHEEISSNYDSNNLLFLFEHGSQKLSSIVSEINKNSNNLYAEQLLKTLGFEIYGHGSSENGITAIKELSDKMGINPNNMKIADGSGLSTFNLISPKQLINLLSYMYKSDSFNEFYQSLAIAGFDGTLADRMKKTKAENNFRGKSGYLQNTRGLAGYVKSADGEPLAVALIVNNFLVPSQLANYILDKVCNRLANFSRN